MALWNFYDFYETTARTAGFASEHEAKLSKNHDSSGLESGGIFLFGAGIEIVTSEFFLFFPTNSI